LCPTATRIGWYGYAPGTAPSFHHTWYLKPQGDACLVVTDEVGKGKDAAQLRETDESLMRRGHDLWLATLKNGCRKESEPPIAAGPRLQGLSVDSL
jgi:hypothetical protein